MEKNSKSAVTGAASAGASAAALKKLLEKKDTEYLLATWETEFTVGGGIAPVVSQQRRHMDPRTIFIAPWHDYQGTNKPLFYNTVNTGLKLNAGGRIANVFVTTDPQPVPIVFLDIPGCFTGTTPYNSPTLEEDTLYFGLAVEAFVRWLRGEGIHPRAVLGQDWETVPALWRCKALGGFEKIVLTLHNIYDKFLKDETVKLGFQAFYGWAFDETVLQAGVRIADSVTTVNRGFRWGIEHEPLPKEVFIPDFYKYPQYIRWLLDKTAAIDNGAFTPLEDREKDLLALFRADEKRGAAGLAVIRRQNRGALCAALGKLPAPEQKKFAAFNGFDAGDKVLIGLYGRPVSQKLHSVAVAALRKLFTEKPQYLSRIVAAFLVLPPDNADDQKRIDLIDGLQGQFPQSVVSYAGRCPLFNEIRAAADLSVMASLYEPHGEAFYGITLPVVRTVDGLAAQVSDPDAENGPAAEMQDRWHDTFAPYNGFVYRESLAGLKDDKSTKDRSQLHYEDYIPGENYHQSLPFHSGNDIFDRMADELAKTIERAVDTVTNAPDRHARMVKAALEQQERTSDWNRHWEVMKKRAL